MVKIPSYNYALLASCFTAVKLNLIVKILNIMRVFAYCEYEGYLDTQ